MHWDCKGSIISRIGGFTHVYIHKLDDIFISEQKKYFKNNQVEEKSLYEIIHNNKKTLFYKLKNSCNKEWLEYTNHKFLSDLVSNKLPNKNFKR